MRDQQPRRLRRTCMMPAVRSRRAVMLEAALTPSIVPAGLANTTAVMSFGMWAALLLQEAWKVMSSPLRELGVSVYLLCTRLQWEINAVSACVAGSAPPQTASLAQQRRHIWPRGRLAPCQRHCSARMPCETLQNQGVVLILILVPFLPLCNRIHITKLTLTASPLSFR
jgi:hypothetical protein